MFHLPRRTRRDRFQWLAVLTTLSLAFGQGTATSKVTAVRFWSLGDVTRVAIETTGEFEMKSDRLDNPDRVFFDLVGAKPELGTKGMHVIAVGDKLLKQIRVAETLRNVTRIVLDLSAPGAEYVASQLTNPDRLMIEVRMGSIGPPSLALSVTGASKLRDMDAKPVAADLTAAIPPHRVYVPPATSVRSEVRLAKAEMLPAPPALPAQNLARTPPLTAAALAELPKPRASRVDPPGVPLPAKRNSTGDRSLVRVLGLKLGRVVLDPGHGGHDTGTTGPTGLREKDLVLHVARRLGDLIEERLGSEVIYTRSDDTFLPLEERTQLANEKKADLFLSIHANSSSLKSAAGVETYYLNFTTSKSALELAARENAESEKSIYELKDLLQKIVLRDKADESREFAAKIQVSLSSFASHANTKSKDRGVKKAPFVVLIGASMPSVLAEIGFVSNTHDEALMKRPEHRQKIAEALYKGLAQYAASLSHFQVAQRKTP